ncbi:hypothetical protein ANN_11120 [Periplaneta americana]|uniref:Uncharacterized protein n=1 Tax=Periplaneta americana TaxID=6978 RepID=A0ABQ8T440_PERAM|nr:hypothetical protein ANN_11120 [Periplaneta americana]
MHDGAPAHYCRIGRAYRNAVYPDQWIGRAGPTPWPARSPDMNPLDFYLWGRLKSLVYASAVPNVEVLQQRIEHACGIVRNEMNGLCNVQRSLRRRAQRRGKQRIPNLTGPVDNNDVTLQRNRNKTAGRIDGCHGDCFYYVTLLLTNKTVRKDVFQPIMAAYRTILSCP